MLNNAPGLVYSLGEVGAKLDSIMERRHSALMDAILKLTPRILSDPLSFHRYSTAGAVLDNTWIFSKLGERELSIAQPNDLYDFFSELLAPDFMYCIDTKDFILKGYGFY